MAELFEVSDFSGGITDYVEKPLKGSQCEKAENLLIETDMGLKARPGTKAWNDTDYDLPFNILGLYELEDFLIAYCSDRFFYYTALDATGSWTKISGPVDSNSVSKYAGKMHAEKWNGHLIISVEPDDKDPDTGGFSDLVTNPPTYKRVPPRKIYVDATTSLPVIRTLQLPKIVIDSITPPSSGSTYSYNYRIAFRREYDAIVEGEVLSFIDYGPIHYETVTSNVEIDGSNTCAIKWHILENDNEEVGGNTYDYGFTDQELWHTTDLLVSVGRSLDAGSLVYQLVEDSTVVKNRTGAASGYGNYDDGVGDGFLSNNATYYDSGGALGYDVMPIGAYYLTVVGDKGYFANLNTVNRRVYQSFDGNPAHTDASVFSEIDEPVTGLSSIVKKPLVFSRNLVYRLEGSKDFTGAGRIIAKLITDRYGCITHGSIVKTDKGVFYFSRTGIGYTNGVKAIIVTEHLHNSYADWTASDSQIAEVYGFYHARQDRIYWRIQDSSSNYHWLVLDLRFGISPQCSFTTIAFHSDINIGVALVHPDTDNILKADTQYIVELDDGETADVIPEASATSGWASAPIEYEFKSSAYSFGTQVSRKKAPTASIVCKDDTDLNGLTLQMIGYNDLQPNGHKLDSCVWFQDMSNWGEDEGMKWGNTNISWNNTRIISFRKYFKSDLLRFLYKQIGLTNLKTLKYLSPDFTYTSSGDEMVGDLYEDSSTRTFTIDTVSDFGTAFPSEVTDDHSWFLTLELDGYDTMYEITGVASGTDLVLTLPPNTEISSGSVTNADLGWKIAQIKKDERFHLKALGLNYDHIGDYTQGSGS